jgi:hypothetical protein
VILTLPGVETVLSGDFIGCGTTQALFLPVTTNSTTACDDLDMLSLIDLDMEKRSFGNKFLVTDFLQNQIDQWDPADQVGVIDVISGFVFCVSI